MYVNPPKLGVQKPGAVHIAEAESHRGKQISAGLLPADGSLTVRNKQLKIKGKLKPQLHPK